MSCCVAIPQYNLQIVQGDTYRKTFKLLDGNKNPIDLTGATARMQIRTSVSSNEVQLELVNGDGLTLGGTEGTIDVEMDTMQTLLPKLVNRPGVYDIEVNIGGIVTTYVGGEVFLILQVTRNP